MTVKPAVDQLLNQINTLLGQLSNDDYSKPIPVLNGSSIGQHVRHTLEFFKCLLDGVPGREVNYDLRKRDVFLESNTLQAKALTDELVHLLKHQETDLELTLIQSYGESEETAAHVQTNLLRELIYNIEHAVHHMALIRIGLKEIKPDLELDQSFGIANSTLRYQKSQAIGSAT